MNRLRSAKWRAVELVALAVAYIVAKKEGIR